MCGAVGVGRRLRKRFARGASPTEGWGQRARAERTRNMELMFMTLDVSRLSGWLNARANCRVKKRACTMRGEVHAGRESEGWWGNGGASGAGTHGEGYN